MSDHKGTLRARGDESPPTTGEESLAASSIGEYLKRQRLLRGISVEDLSATTRIPLRSLERLEAGYFDGVSDGFVRGFVRTVALALGLDADQAVARMLDEPVAGKWDRDGAALWRKQLLAVVALVAVAGLGFFGLRLGWNLLVGGRGTSQNREIVLWTDPVHELAREQARRRESTSAPGRGSDAGSDSDAVEELGGGRS